jgi:hypothetical protein
MLVCCCFFPSFPYQIYIHKDDRLLESYPKPNAETILDLGELVGFASMNCVAAGRGSVSRALSPDTN